MKTRSYLLLLILLTVSYFPAFAGEYAYVLRFNPEEPECIVQFNTDKDEIVRTIEIPAKKAFNNMIVDENGGCYISDYYYFSDYGRDIYYYDTRENQIKRFMDTGSAFGPHYMALTKDYLIVQAEGRDETRGHGGVIFIDRKKKEIVGQVFLKEDEPYFRIVNVLNMFQGDDKYVFLTTDYLIDQDVAKIGTFECFDNGDIYVIDINKKELFKTIEIPRDYRFIFGGCNMGDKIYIAAATKGLRTYETDWPSNR
ncbi:MAG: hypothetical protein NTV06_10055, partial [candidate division Zixibacteria bacterium]|nr:hypothetical protein [candidate division Zixibacteria bacterium]